MADTRLPEGDKPLSVADSAPETVEIAGAKARIPSQADLRIAALIDEKLDLSEDHYAAVILYCCLHTNKKAISQLWQKAWKDSKKLYEDDIVYWMFKTPQKSFQRGLEGIMEHLQELSDEQELDADESGEDDGKKKTSQQ